MYTVCIIDFVVQKIIHSLETGGQVEGLHLFRERAWSTQDSRPTEKAHGCMTFTKNALSLFLFLSFKCRDRSVEKTSAKRPIVYNILVFRIISMGGCGVSLY